MIIETITYIDRDSASATFVLHNFSLCVLCGSRWCSAVVMVCARSPRCGMGGDTCATSCFVARTRTHPITLTHTHARMMPQHRGIPRACKGHRHFGDRESCIFRADVVLFRCPRSRLATPARPARLVRASGRAQGRALEGCVGWAEPLSSDQQEALGRRTSRGFKSGVSIFLIYFILSFLSFLAIESNGGGVTFPNANDAVFTTATKHNAIENISERTGTRCRVDGTPNAEPRAYGPPRVRRVPSVATWSASEGGRRGDER